MTKSVWMVFIVSVMVVKYVMQERNLNFIMKKNQTGSRGFDVVSFL